MGTTYGEGLRGEGTTFGGTTFGGGPLTVLAKNRPGNEANPPPAQMNGWSSPSNMQPPSAAPLRVM